MLPLAIVSVLVVAGIVLLVVLSHRPEWKMTSSTAGQVVRCEEREVRASDERREETLIIVRYRVAGEEHQVQRIGRGRLAWKYPPGTAVQVRYNPAEPGMARFD